MSQNGISTLSTKKKLIGKDKELTPAEIKIARAKEKMKIATEDKEHHAKLRKAMHEAEDKLRQKETEERLEIKKNIQAFLSDNNG